MSPKYKKPLIDHLEQVFAEAFEESPQKGQSVDNLLKRMLLAKVIREAYKAGWLAAGGSLDETTEAGTTVMEEQEEEEMG